MIWLAGLAADARAMQHSEPRARSRWLAANLLAIRGIHAEPARVDPHRLPWHYRLMIRLLRIDWPHAARRALGDRAARR